jgi:hypothetical protein
MALTPGILLNNAKPRPTRRRARSARRRNMGVLYHGCVPVYKYGSQTLTSDLLQDQFAAAFAIYTAKPVSDRSMGFPIRSRALDERKGGQDDDDHLPFRLLRVFGFVRHSSDYHSNARIGLLPAHLWRNSSLALGEPRRSAAAKGHGRVLRPRLVLRGARRPESSLKPSGQRGLSQSPTTPPK